MTSFCTQTAQTVSLMYFSQKNTRFVFFFLTAKMACLSIDHRWSKFKGKNCKELKEESEEECLMQRGREFQIAVPMYWKGLSPRVFLTASGTRPRNIRISEAERREREGAEMKQLKEVLRSTIWDNMEADDSYFVLESCCYDYRTVGQCRQSENDFTRPTPVNPDSIATEI